MLRYKVHVEAAKLGFTILLNLRADPVRLSMWACYQCVPHTNNCASYSRILIDRHEISDSVQVNQMSPDGPITVVPWLLSTLIILFSEMLKFLPKTSEGKIQNLSQIFLNVPFFIWNLQNKITIQQ
jgi:hypothetical protein